MGGHQGRRFVPEGVICLGNCRGIAAAGLPRRRAYSKTKSCRRRLRSGSGAVQGTSLTASNFLRILLANYRIALLEEVLQAFQNVADVLRALDADATTLKAQAEAEAAARATLDLTQKQFKLGAVSYLSLLNAQQQYQQTKINLVQAQAARFADTAALFQALGGGWWNRSEAETAEMIRKD